MACWSWYSQVVFSLPIRLRKFRELKVSLGLIILDASRGPISQPRRAALRRIGAFHQEWHTGLTVDADCGPLHRLVLRRFRHLEWAQAVGAGQNEITGAARARPSRGGDHLRKVGVIGRFSSQLLDGLQEFRELQSALFEPAARPGWLRKLALD